MHKISAWALSLILTAAGSAAGARAQDVRSDYHPPAQRVSPADGFAATMETHGSTPMTADGHADLTGIWTGPFPTPLGPYHNRSLPTLEPDQATMQRGNTWNRPVYKPEFWEKVYNLDFGKVDVDPDFKCMPKGVPRQGAPQQIIQTPTQVVLVNGEDFRIVPTDGRARSPDDGDYDNYGGVGLGHWEGDTLVIESVGFNDISWIQWPGFFHTNKMSVVERLRRKGDVLFYTFTVSDPDVLARPWVSDTYVKRLNPNPLARLDEVAPCKEQDLNDIVDIWFRG